MTQLNRREDIAQCAGTDRAQVDALLALARTLQDDDPNRARALAEQAHPPAAARGYEAGVARSLHVQGHADYRLGARDRAQELYGRALEVSRRCGERAVEADCLHDLGLLANIRADYPAALAFHHDALRLYEALDDPAAQAQTLNDLGNAHMGQEDLGQALPFYLESLGRREALGDEAGVGCSLNNIGNVHAVLGDNARALDCYVRCLEVSRRTGATRLESRCQGNLTDIYIALGRPEEALENARAAHTLARRHSYRSDECYALIAQGSAHKAAGRAALAVPPLQEALALAESLSDRSCVCQSHLLLGEALLDVGELADARLSLSRAAEMAESLSLRQFLFRVFQGLSRVCKAEGDFQQGLAHHERFHELEKEVLNDNADRRLQALMIQMDVENAQKEAAFSRQEAELHRLKTVELAQTNQALRQANEDKEQLVEEMRAQADELERLASQDGLTGLYNRRYLEGWLTGAFSEARRGGRRLTVVLADIDHFKEINDRFGHQAGDEVLMTVARLMRQACRDTDIVARYGGEEFLLALLEAGVSQAAQVCERVRREIETYPWREIHPDLSVTVSLGFSDDLSVAHHERLLSLADAQLYEAKRRGRNQVCGQERTTTEGCPYLDRVP